jgi:uncharacterized surface protein with fasciclin (FAS1) repeats
MADHHKMSNASVPSKNIVETASAAPNLSTLVTAVSAAGLVDTLASPGPFTVFAPTNAAFEKLTARLSGNSVVITDGKGGQSAVTTVDVMQSNGVVHIIDSVLLP